MPLQAITFDYWDTLYSGSATPERVSVRRAAMQRMLVDLGHSIPEDEFLALYKASAQEADRWWREEQRGYTAGERIRWMLKRMSIERPEDCEHVARAVKAVDDALVEYPPPLLDGAAQAILTLSGRYRLGMISDTGFASGKAQDLLLERCSLRRHFDVSVYSVDIGHAKPRPEPFRAALDALGLPAADVVHIGDNERTDVRGALDMGMRAIRVDFVKQNGPSAAEFVARDFDSLVRYLLDQGEGSVGRGEAGSRRRG
jgi:putative hydrolase of the HAD superfamily